MFDSASNFWRAIFAPGNFTPHSEHFINDPWAMWLIVAGNALSVLAYTLIPVTILFVVWKRKDLLYNWMFLLFGTFIVLCGATHALHIMIFWYPAYRFEAVVEFLTFIASFATFLMFLYIMPTVVKLTSPKQMEDANAALIKEIQVRQEIQEKLRQKIQDIDKSNIDVLAKNDELKRINAIMAGRESRIVELEREISDIKKKHV